MTILVLLTCLIVGFTFSVPVAFCMGISSLICILLFEGAPPFIIIQRMISAVDSFTMISVPLYIFVGRIMNSGGITRRIFNFCKSIVGHRKGGLAYVNVLCSMIFAGMSGSALADTAGLGQIEVEAMEENGFDRPFSATVTAVSATIGPIIPPSITLVIYGGLAEVSIGQLFMGGLVPGILMGIGMCFIIFIISKRRNYPVSDKASFKEIVKSLWQGLPAFGTVVIIIGGILGGFFTASEAAGIAAVYSIILTLTIKSITLKDLFNDLKETAILSGAVMLIMCTSTSFSWLVTLEQVPKHVANILFSITDNNFVILLIINCVLIIMGMFVDGNSILAMTVPVFVPIALSMGMNLVQFGIIMALNLMIGTITPPFAMCYFSVCGVVDVRYEDVVREGWAFYFPLLAELLLICLIPALTLWLPGVLFK